MEGFEKSEETLDYLPSGFLKKLNSADELWDLDEYDLMVRVVATEAERLSREGKERVAHVIMNRLKHPNVGLFGGFDIKSVIEKPGAFKTIDVARASDSTMERLKNPSLRSRYRSIKSKILDPQQHIRKRALAEALKAAGEVYFDGKEDNTGGATNLYANTVSGDKKAGGIGGNILSINKGDSGSEDDPLGPGFEGDPEGDTDSDPKGNLELRSPEKGPFISSAPEVCQQVLIKQGSWVGSGPLIFEAYKDIAIELEATIDWPPTVIGVIHQTDYPRNRREEKSRWMTLSKLQPQAEIGFSHPGKPDGLGLYSWALYIDSSKTYHDKFIVNYRIYTIYYNA